MWLEIPYVQAFFTLCSLPSLCESCSTSQILLAHSGPHPSNTISPNPCSDSSSSFDPFDHSPLPYCSQSHCSSSRSSFKTSTLCSLLLPSFCSSRLRPLPCLRQRRALRHHPHPLPQGSQGSIPDLPRSPPYTQPRTTLKQETSQQDPAPFPVPLLPLQEVGGAEGIVWVHVPFSLTICIKLKSILAASPQTLIII